jgi:hypothetical protein
MISLFRCRFVFAVSRQESEQYFLLFWVVGNSLLQCGHFFVITPGDIACIILRLFISCALPAYSPAGSFRSVEKLGKTDRKMCVNYYITLAVEEYNKKHSKRM